MGVAEEYDVAALFLRGERQRQEAVINALAVPVGTKELVTFELEYGVVFDNSGVIGIVIAVATHEDAGSLGRACPFGDLLGGVFGIAQVDKHIGSFLEDR